MAPEARASSVPTSADPPEPDRQGQLSVGAVAARLGVAPATVRSWGHRYGLTPSARTAGGHRRFSADDVERLARMQRLVAEGVAPAEAARLAMAPPDGSRSGGDQRPQLDDRGDPGSSRRGRGARGGPGGRVLAVPGASSQARGLARAATRLDADGMERILDRMLAERGAIASWEQVLRPVLVAAGERWMTSGDGIEIEHMLSESVMAASWRYRRLQQPALPGRPIVLACSPDDLHVLPLYVLAAALAELRVPTRQLGARVPLAALTAATRRTGASAVFVWRQIAGRSGAPTITLPPSRPPVRLVVGGPGWAEATLDPGTEVAADLQEAVEILHAAATG